MIVSGTFFYCIQVFLILIPFLIFAWISDGIRCILRIEQILLQNESQVEKAIAEFRTPLVHCEVISFQFGEVIGEMFFELWQIQIQQVGNSCIFMFLELIEDGDEFLQLKTYEVA